MGDSNGSAANPLSKETLASLRELRGIALDVIEQEKGIVADIDAEIANRLGASAKQAFVQAGKDRGTVRLPLQGGLEAKVEIKPTVKWDSEALMNLAATMPFADARKLFKIEFSMGETAYKGVKLANPDLAAKIDEARTVKFSEPKITLEKKEA